MQDRNSDDSLPISNREYTSLVSIGSWPEDRIVPLPTPFVDSRGKIQNVLLSPINSVVVIESKAGSVRANHYHKTDWHYCYVVSGKILYLERPVGSSDVPDPKVMGPGNLFFTPPMVEHAMVFTEDTVFLTLSRNVRTHEAHEEDLVRVDHFVTGGHRDSLCARKW